MKQRTTREQGSTREAVAATTPSGSDNSSLFLIGGLALVALVLGDMIFLAQSIRVLRTP